MARSRIVKPDFFQHSGLFDAESETGLPLRLSFLGLWGHCDREGRFRWKPRELKLGILPFDPVDFGEVLAALESHGFVVGYEVDGERYGWIPSLGKHQHFHHREAKSLIPPCPAKARPSPGLGSTKARPSPRPALDQDSLGEAKARPSPTASASTSASASASTSASKDPGVARSNHRGGWPADAATLWAEHIGVRSPAEFGKQLAPAVQQFGWPDVRAALDVYCKAAPYRKRDGTIFGDSPNDKPGDLPVKNTTFCSPADFVKNITQWRDRLKPLFSEKAGVA